MKRPVTIGLAVVLLGATFWALRSQTGARAEGAMEAEKVKVKVFKAAGELVGPIEMPRVVKSDEQWQAQLGPEVYKIARNKGTEAPFCGNLIHKHRSEE